jgi:hypothetical protein
MAFLTVCRALLERRNKTAVLRVLQHELPFNVADFKRVKPLTYMFS